MRLYVLLPDICGCYLMSSLFSFPIFFDILQTAANMWFRVTINRLINGENKLMRRCSNGSRWFQPCGSLRVLFPPLSFCPPHLPPEMNGGNRPAPEPVMVFWFHFSISSLSHFDKVTNCCHLQHPTPFTQAHPNAIINMKYSAQTGENISVYCSEIKPGLRCQLLSASSRAKKWNISPGDC